MTKQKTVKDDPFAKERRLRRLATKLGFTLVRPWAAERRKVGSSGFACYVLVPHHNGLSLEEVEEILRRDRQQHH